jgi:hypothetical protein
MGAIVAVAGAADPLVATATVSILASTAAGAPVWPFFNSSMGGAPYWLMLHAFFVAPQYGFPVQQVGPIVGAGTGTPA